VRRRAAGLGLLLAACHGEPAVAPEDCPSIERRPPAAAYGQPADLLVDGCAPGAMAGFDPALVYLVRAGFSSEILRLEESCHQLTTAEHEHVELTADHLYWSSSNEAGLLCQDRSGQLIGRKVFCYPGDDDRCVEAEVTAEPLGQRDEPAALGVELLAEVPPPAGLSESDAFVVDVRVVDDVAYLVLRGGLLLIDVSDPGAPTVLSFVPAAFDAFNDVDLFVGRDGRRYALATGTMLVFLDVEDPRRPVEVHRMSLDGGHTVFTETIDRQTTAYVVSQFSGRNRILDVSRPTAVVPLGGWFEPSHDLQVIDRIGYVNATGAGFLMVDFRNPAAPAVLGTTPQVGYSHAVAVTTAGGRRVAVHGDEGVASFIRIIDVDPASAEYMRVIGHFTLDSPLSVHNVVAVGERAYVAWYQHGLRVLDLSDPTSPRAAGHFNTWQATASRGGFFEGALGVDRDPRTGVVYVADSHRGLLVLRER
jgi:hypothetical protein